jgi:hypothetical protein
MMANKRPEYNWGPGGAEKASLRPIAFVFGGVAAVAGALLLIVHVVFAH